MSIDGIIDNKDRLELTALAIRIGIYVLMIAILSIVAWSLYKIFSPKVAKVGYEILEPKANWSILFDSSKKLEAAGTKSERLFYNQDTLSELH